MFRLTVRLLFFSALMVSLLPLCVQAALPKELPVAPAKFLTGSFLTRSEDLGQEPHGILSADHGVSGIMLEFLQRRQGMFLTE